MKRLGKRLANEWRRLRVALIVLALGGTVWTVVLRFTTGLSAPLCDRLPATVGLAMAAAALVLPLVSLCGDGRLARLAARRGGRLPRCPILAPKFLVCLGGWVVVAAWASAIGFVCSPSAECLAEWLRMLAAGWLWVLLALCGAFFASAAAGQLRTAIGLALFLAILPPFLMRYPFELSLSAGGGHGTKAIVGGLATLWLLGAAALAFRTRLATPATWWAKGTAGLKTGACAALAVLCAAAVVPLLIVVALLRLGPGDATMLVEPCLSPDGRFVAFMAYFDAWPFDPPARSCYVLNTQTGQARRLSRFQQSGLDHRVELGWSPCGRYLVYCFGPGPFERAWLKLAGREVSPYESLGVFDTETSDALEDLTGDRVFRLVVSTNARKRLREAPPAEPGWRSEDPKGRGFVLGFSWATEPGSLGGALHLSNGRTGTRVALGRIDESVGDVSHCCMFSPGGRWLLYPARDGDGPLGLWLHELAGGERRRLDWPGPLRLKSWLPQFTPDETKLVWSPRDATRHPESYPAGEMRFYVQDLASGASRLLKLPEGATGREWGDLPAAVDSTYLYFVRGATLCRVRLDGTGLESLFPTRAPLPR